MALRQRPIPAARHQKRFFSHVKSSLVMGDKRMTSDKVSKQPPAESSSLDDLLSRNKDIKRNVDESGAELGDVNAVFDQERGVSQEIVDAYAQNKATERSIVVSGLALGDVNRSLANEIEA
ncbi:MULTISPECIES: hypothetical protein [unclassified Cyanobium]|uniref:hypothetical protein n=1 Tax=unclassified Cyanobium TaxID=2627006 RepID=UPI0020CCCAFD|nr:MULTISPECIES: hypothetical protein [unclassified Cyanobium]MCP9834260.1 hypothetical protein [Cyanobium sp. La Preciosa 7G6]MCP9937104.1 hypothetical protein [Cyanobium sp. Aljojuca 7A6]